MAYTLIPEGFELKKVTKQQKDAVDEYFGRERRGTYFEALLGNEKVPLLVAGGVVLVSAPTILKIIFDALAKQKPELDIDIAEAGINYLTFVKDFGEAFFELSGPTGGVFEGEIEDFWSKYVKR